jgi:hydroxymethylpyrimidine/phosphomethylpyrimidine kinase
VKALWEGTQAEAAGQYEASRDGKYAAFGSVVEAELAKRELAAEAVTSATNATVKAITQRRDANFHSAI